MGTKRPEAWRAATLEEDWKATKIEPTLESSLHQRLP